MSYPALIVTALVPLPWAFLACAAVLYAAEIAAPEAAARLVRVLDLVRLGTTFRLVTRQAAAVVLLARALGSSSAWFAAVVCGLFLAYSAGAVRTGLTLWLDRRLTLRPIDTRNLALTSAGEPASPPLWPGVLRYLDAVPVIAVALSAGLRAEWLGAAGTGVVLLGEAAALIALIPALGAARRPAGRRGYIASVEAAVKAYAPEVLLYFSGSRDSAYQATMWLETLERLDRRALVVLREREPFQLLGPTTLPIVCVPSAVDLMNFRGFDSARAALYVSNVGKNIHLLRKPGLTSVFIGHGDSDKEASFNPFSKVYDEVWVAGQAGRDRYQRAGIGVRDENIVEVGRPQLAGIRTTGPGGRRKTVLYAPTWEGWTEDLFHTSIAMMGPRLIRALLGHTPALRLIYKPHPLTGCRDHRARAAHLEILAEIRAASGDHLAVEDSEPHLYDCFNRCDLLITDISSVVADFLASGKPYAVTNVAGLPDDVFREMYPSAEAAYPLGPDLAALHGVLAQLYLDGKDDLAEARRKLKIHLLGPDHPDAMTRFNQAVNRLCAPSPDSAGW